MHIFREFPFDDRVTSGVNDGKQDIANLDNLRKNYSEFRVLLYLWSGRNLIVS